MNTGSAQEHYHALEIELLKKDYEERISKIAERAWAYKRLLCQAEEDMKRALCMFQGDSEEGGCTYTSKTQLSAYS